MRVTRILCARSSALAVRHSDLLQITLWTWTWTFHIRHVADFVATAFGTSWSVVGSFWYILVSIRVANLIKSPLPPPRLMFDVARSF